MKKSVGFVFLVLMLAAAQCSGGSAAPKITVENVWSRPSPVVTGNGVIYLTLKNNGGSDDVLVSVASNVAKATELHESKMEGDVMKMIPVPSIPIPAGKSVKLEPGGKHIMLINLQQALKPGGTISVTLNFEKSGAMTLDVPVKESGK